MLVYGDPVREADTRDALGDAGIAVSSIAAAPGIARHGALVAAFVAMGELAQGIADAEFDVRGVDARSPAQDATLTALVAVARRIAQSWRGGLAGFEPVSPDLLTRVAASPLPGRIRIRQAEGYAFYAVYPEAYMQAAAALSGARMTRVIGIRSIGASLAAAVAAAAGAPDPVTVRPTGHPFRREIRLSDALGAELARDRNATFAVVDEGPGLSGSSFGAVADELERHGVAPGRIHFFPGHDGDLGPQASDAHRQRWQRAPRHVVAFDDLVLRAATPAHRLESWVADVVGAPERPLEDISGGRWRARGFPDAARWPPAHVQQERRKFLLAAGGRRWLIKFAGLGRTALRKLDLARALHAAGFVPEPVGFRHGFLVERWIEDAEPPGDAFDRGRLVDHLGRYIGFRAASFPAAADDGASLQLLLEMAKRNAGLALGAGAAERLAAWSADLAGLADAVSRVRTDNRLHRWEWLQTAGSALIKTDALDHHAAHDLVGCQDPSWDIAGAAVEFDLTGDEEAELCRRVERAAGHGVSRGLLAFSKRCYLAFQLGSWSMAADALVGDPDESVRARRLADAYARKLAPLL